MAVKASDTSEQKETKLLSARRSNVEVEVRATGNNATIVVKDRGPGIPPEQQNAIFEPLFQGRAAWSARNGIGLGLFLARAAVESHGGVLRVESDGSGSIFHILLPAADSDGGAYEDV